MERLQQELQKSFELTPNIRGIGQGGFPALNIGRTPQSIEIYAFAPGLDPSAIEIDLDRNILTIAGVRNRNLPEESEKTTIHINERFSGKLRRVISLPEDCDPDSVSANYREGVLNISIKRKESSAPRRINVQ